MGIFKTNFSHVRTLLHSGSFKLALNARQDASQLTELVKIEERRSLACLRNVIICKRLDEISIVCCEEHL